MQKNYKELKKKGLKGTVAIGIVVATLLLMHSCFSDKETDENKKQTNIGDKKIEKMGESTNINEKEKLVFSDEDVNSSIKGGVIKSKDSKSESLITEGDSFKTNKLKGETALKTQDEKTEDTQIFKVKKKSKNKNEIIEIASEDNISDVNESDRSLIKEEKKVKEQEKEHSLLVFGSLGFEKINHSSSKDTGSIDPIDPIDPDKPDRPDIDNLKPITPEVPVTEVIIWENGNEINGNKYTLKNNLEMIDDIDGLKTTGGTITNEATINSDAWFGENYAMRAEDHADGRQGIAINKGNITGGSNGMIATNGGEIINETTGTINVLGKAMTSDGAGTSATNKGDIIGETGGMIAKNSGTIINEGTTNGMKAFSNSTAINNGETGRMDASHEATMTNYNKASDMWAYNSTIINEVGGVISTSDSLISDSHGMYAREGSTAINKGEIRVALSPGKYGMYATGGSTIINEKDGTIINSADGGMRAGGAGSIATNKGEIQSGNRGSGMGANSDAVAINEETGIITGSDNHNGMYADGARSLVRNKGTISNSGTTNMLAYRGGQAINEETGILSNSKETGMEAGGGNGSTAINRGTIKDSQINGMRDHTGTHVENTLTGKILNSGEAGMYVAGVGSTGVNFGTISDSGSNGMYAEGQGTVINEKSGKIISSKESGMHVNGEGASGINNGEITSEKQGMYTNEGAITNNNLITVNGDFGIGMRVDGGTAVNKGIITSNGGSNIGIKVSNNGTAVNEGTISTKGNFGMEIESGGTGTNEGTISNEGHYGIKAESGGVGLNDTTGIISNKGQNGMYADINGTVVNKGTISNEDAFGMFVAQDGTGLNDIGGIISNNGNYGIQVQYGGSVINKGTVSNKGRTGIYAIGDGATGLNDITGIISNNDAIGMYATSGGNVTNKGLIRNLGGQGMISSSTGSIALNDTEGIISNTGERGMDATGGGQGINKGTISNESSIGFRIAGTSIGINETSGMISNNGSYGMYIENLGSNGINKGTISNHSDYGLYTHGNGATATNDGTISNLGDYGIWAGGYSSVINNGTVSNTGNYRMQAMSKSTAINNGDLDDGFDNYTVMRGNDQSNLINTGTIDINYSHSTAMRGEAGGTVVNEGTININGDYGKGMYINGGGIATNGITGVINLNASNGTGIYAEGSGTKVVNNGTINLSGSSSDGEATDNKNNRSIYLGSGASLVNSGTFKSDQNINFDEMGDGKFIMSSGGTVKADKIEGDIYASGALAMGGYDDVYSTYKMLETNELDGNIISNSAMFDAHFTDNADDNGFYDVVLDRKDFNTIVSNEEIGKILEDNYEDNGNELKEDYYDALKLVSTEKGLDKAVEDSYGMSYYPTLAKQTFEIVNDSNQVIVDNVINNERIRRDGETIAIAGVNATRLENDSHDNASGYDTDLYSVYLGAEKQINKHTRIGGIITIGKGDTDLNDTKGSREDYYYQGNVYYTYENEDRLKFTSMIFAGITDTSLERTLAFGSLYETMEDDINNYYIGLNNELSKKYYFGQNYIKPKFELNFTYMMQDDILESGDQGVEIDGENSTSLETGLGIALGRDFYFESGSKINLEGSVTGYAELGDPYKDLDSTFNTLSTDKVKIDGYNNDDFYGDIMIGGSYETKDSLKLYTKIGYRIGNDSDGPIGNIGFNYLF